MSKYHALLWGSHRSNNFGDSLLAYLFAKSVSSQGWGVIAPTLNSEAARAISTVARIENGAAADAVVMHGGGYFGEPPSGTPTRWAFKFMRNHFLPNAANLIKRKPLIISGVGVGPIRSPIAKVQLHSLFQRANLVSVRDEESRRWLEIVGVKRQIEVIPDLALAVRALAPELLSSQPPARRFITVHLGGDCEGLLPTEVLCAGLAKLAKEGGMEVALVDDHEGDAARAGFCRSVAAQLSTLGVGATYHPYSRMDDLLKIIESSAIILTDKLHVGICGTGLGSVVVSFPKHSKTSRFYAQMQVPEAIQKELVASPREFVRRVRSVEERFADSNSAIAANTKAAIRHGELVKSFLGAASPA